MWIIVFFDLPTDTKRARKQYTRFRKDLLEDGFAMMQYSVYYRHCASKENTEVHLKRVRTSVPPDGEVRVVQFTDKQFSEWKSISENAEFEQKKSLHSLNYFNKSSETHYKSVSFRGNMVIDHCLLSIRSCRVHGVEDALMVIDHCLLSIRSRGAFR